MENIEALDSTLLREGGRWWLFATIREYGRSSPNDELFIFSSEDLLGGQWEAHPMNPVISDVTRARPAGRIFRDGEYWIRPSQDCSELYGYAFNFSRILTLTREEYEEELLTSVYPNWDDRIKGTHSFAREGSLTVIDALRMRSRV